MNDCVDRLLAKIYDVAIDEGCPELIKQAGVIIENYVPHDEFGYGNKDLINTVQKIVSHPVFREMGRQLEKYTRTMIVHGSKGTDVTLILKEHPTFNSLVIDIVSAERKTRGNLRAMRHKEVKEPFKFKFRFNPDEPRYLENFSFSPALREEIEKAWRLFQAYNSTTYTIFGNFPVRVYTGPNNAHTYQAEVCCKIRDTYDDVRLKLSYDPDEPSMITV